MQKKRYGESQRFIEWKNDGMRRETAFKRVKNENVWRNGTFAIKKDRHGVPVFHRVEKEEVRSTSVS